MRKNGFTLIELLAVIVILAIIALIATPIILGIINDARKESNERSVELYASAVKNAIATYQLTGTSAPKSFSDLAVQYDGDVKCTVQELYKDGSFYLEGCKANNSEKEYSYGVKKEMCTLDDKDSNGVASLSDVVTCGTESFYVMKTENEKVTMLSMFNLYVGNSVDPSGGVVTPLENSTGIQDEKAKGGIGSSIWYGNVVFSTSNYWNSTVSNYPAYVYNENNDVIYPYVSEYERVLKEELNVSSAKATLISYEQLEGLHCSGANHSCSNAPSWVYSTQYWTGTADSDGYVWRVSALDWASESFSEIHFSGIRPVVTISVNEIG